MELRRSSHMRLKLWNAALLAALVLAFGTFAHPRASQAGANDDVEFVQPPGTENGDPDTGSGNRYFITYIHFYSLGSGWTMQIRLPRLLRASLGSGPTTRPVVQTRRRALESKK
jgi:hypothetical protein